MKAPRLMLYGLLSLAAPLVAVAAPPSTSFFVVAHADDWQLFMNPNAYRDLRNANARTVIVHTTAGDAGAGTGRVGRQQPFYLAREEGALRALRFIKSADGALGQQTLGEETRTVNGHALTRFASTDGLAVMYFLRLPDGQPSGSGYAATGSQSIRKLKTDGKPISAVDGSTTYRSWEDLTATLAQLIRQEASGSRSVWVNIADTDTTENPGDHSDHIHTSLAIQDARLKVSTCINRALFVEYATQNKPATLTGEDLVINAAVWGATTSGIADFDHASTFEPGHNVWLSRNVLRTLGGTGHCTF